MNTNVAKWVTGLVILFFGVVSISVFAEKGDLGAPNGGKFSYVQMMRQIKDVGKSGFGELETKKSDAIVTLDQFVKSEERTLDRLGVSNAKQKKYFQTLATQKKMLEEGITPTPPTNEAKMPEKPARFQFSDDNIIIKKLNNARVIPQKGQKLSSALLKLVTVETADATAPQFMPTISDVQADGKEILINQEIRELAASLNNNPVKIFNWVRNSITYEPYYGAKKGSIGCLKERVCNDTDASSLTIAILRASGIPARYEKSAAVFTVEQLRSLVGVAETKTAFAAFCTNKVPIHTLTDLLDGVPFTEADFGQETHLALEWTHVQLYYDYDQRGANIDNSLTFAPDATTDSVRTKLQPYPKKQWIPMDVIVKSYTRTQKPILVDQAGFNSENFWNGFFQYQGDLSPIAKYSADLLAVTGQQVTNNLSTKSAAVKNLDILPITLPYAIGAGVGGDIQIPWEQLSSLQDVQRTQVKITLRRESNDEVVLSKTFFGSEINNAKIDLRYDGLTDVDKAVIEDNGGIYATPASLVDIAPYFQIDDARYEGVNGGGGRLGATIGDTLVLKFEYFVNGESVYDDEKFSVAGNQEGIFVTLSNVKQDTFLDNLSDPKRNSHVLLDGNASLAREYLRHVQADGDILKQSLDYEYNIQFGRAVITQTRILNEVDGTPTTFDFKGLSLDAAVYINDYSNRGIYNNHRKDFRLLWGQQASYMEGQIFNEISGLDGISTVQGLQFAYSQPGTYTMHRITSANEGEIDQLNLSANTKANMHTDVAAGDTIITPDRLIEDQNWHGILYVSLRPDWTAQYAIGEQTAQNGGWTKEGFEIMIVTTDGEEIARFVNEGTTDNFIFAEDVAGNDKKCRISRAESLNIMNNVEPHQGWDIQYGLPCLEEELSFGEITHKYILTTDGAKFYSPNKYAGYWITETSVLDKISAYSTSSGVDYGYDNFRFSPVVGTFIQSVCMEDGYWNCDNDSYATVYYSPNNTNGSVYRIEKGFLTRADANNAAIMRTLGFPESDEIRHDTPNGFGTSGSYQNFVSGRLYWNSTLSKAFYMFWKLANYYDQNGGSEGKFGSPVEDTRLVSGKMQQDLEGTRLVEDNNGAVSHLAVWYKSIGDNNFLIINLNSNNVCFKNYVALDNGVHVSKQFHTIVSQDPNRLYNGQEPIGAINGDFVDENAPMGINYSFGINYSGWRTSGYCAMGISKARNVMFSPVDGDFTADYKNNVVIGGGPRIFADGASKNLSCFKSIGAVNCEYAHNQRTIVGVTDQNYMIALVTKHGAGIISDNFDNEINMLNSFRGNYGPLKDANMFDGGASPSMYFDGGIKQAGTNDLASVLMMYQGAACTQ